MQRLVQEDGLADVEHWLGLTRVVVDGAVLSHGFVAAGGETTLQARQVTSATSVGDDLADSWLKSTTFKDML